MDYRGFSFRFDMSWFQAYYSMDVLRKGFYFFLYYKIDFLVNY